MKRNDVFARLLGHEISKDMKAMILKKVAETHEPLEKVVSQFTLPEIMLLAEDGRFEYNGVRMTLSDYYKAHPLGEYAPVVVIGTHDRLELHNKLNGHV